MSHDKHLRCSFCGKSKDAVRKFISGPSVYICNECIALCNEILAEDEEREVAEALTRGKTSKAIATALYADGLTTGHAAGCPQGNLVVLPAAYAADFEAFCLANPQACPLLGRGAPGQAVLDHLGADLDIRTEDGVGDAFATGGRAFVIAGTAVLIFLGYLDAAPVLSPLLWHAHEMLFGFAAAVIVGFLLTAGKAWTGLQTPRGLEDRSCRRGRPRSPCTWKRGANMM